MSELKIVTNLHRSTKRNYLKRMIDNKVKSMTIAKKYGYDYWDGNRRYGYGGYKYIPGKWTFVAKKLIEKYKLNNNSKILDIGCGDGSLIDFLSYKFKNVSHFFLVTPIVAPLLPVVLVCCPLTLSPQ